MRPRRCMFIVYTVCGNVFCLLLFPAAPWCQPGGESLSSSGRGTASPETVGRATAGYTRHQLHGHQVRTTVLHRNNKYSTFWSKKNHSHLHAVLHFAILRCITFNYSSRVRIVFSTLKKFSKFEVVFGISLINHFCVLQVESFKNLIGSTT